GYTASEDFPYDPTGTPKNDNKTSLSPCPFPGCFGNIDAFVSVITPDGSNLRYSTCLGGNLSDAGTSIYLDKEPGDEGYVYVTGFTNSDNFPISDDAIQKLLNLGLPTTACDAFTVWYKPGTPVDRHALGYYYSSYLGGSNNDQGLGIASFFNGVNSTFYVTSWTQSTNFPIYPSITTTLKGGKDGFVTKFDATGISPVNVYSIYLGGAGNDEGKGIAVKNISVKEYAYITGVTYSTDFPQYPPTRFGGPIIAPWAYRNFGTTSYGDAFITKLEPEGKINWSTYLGGLNSDGGNGIALDDNNNIYITGYTSSSDFPSVNPIPGFKYKKSFQDVFITMVNANMASLNFSTFLGGTLDETGTGIAVMDPQNIFISGFTTSFDFPTSLNYPGVKSFNTMYDISGNHFAGWVDGFVVRINNAPTPAFPGANFTADKWAGSFDLTVNFTDTSTGSPTAWSWNFGDGTPILTGVQNPTHVYTAPGSFSVTLTVSNAIGTNSKIGGPVIVSAPPAPKITNCNSTVGITRVLLATNSTRTLSLLLWNTANGLSTYNVTMGFNDTRNTTFTGVYPPNWMPAPQFIFNPMSFGVPVYNVTFSGVDFNQTKSNFNVSLGCFQVKGTQEGESVLILKNYSLQDYGYNGITLTPYQNVTIVVRNLYPIPASNPNGNPTDMDLDNLYEDVNGDHQRNYLDVIWFFNNYGYISSLPEYWEFFDFNHNGVLDLGDTIGLFRIIYG
ncbi:MAG: SBBP repeat-containing protein, partial [Methanomicrobiales archaeon]